MSKIQKIKWILFVLFWFISIPYWIWKKSDLNTTGKYLASAGVFLMAIFGFSMALVPFDDPQPSTSELSTDEVTTEESIQEEMIVEEPVIEQVPPTNEEQINSILENTSWINEFTFENGEVTVSSDIIESSWNMNDYVETFWRNYINLSQELYSFDEVSYVYASETGTFIDNKGNESQAKSIELGIPKNVFKKYTWHNLNFRPAFSIITDASDRYFIHPAIVKEIDLFELELKFINEQ